VKRALVLLGLMCAAADAAELSILVPLYSYPSWYNPPTYLWDDVAAAASQVPVTAIINPNNGPDGGPPNSDYGAGLNDLRAAGVTILGYVFTSYGARNITNVEADIDLYDQHFNINGIFLDEVANTTNQLAYYQQLYAYIKAKPHLKLVFSNPGTQTDQAYIAAPIADTTVIFENNTGWSSYVADAYVSSYPAARFAALPYSAATESLMRSNIDLAVQRNIGFIYITNDGGSNPWDTLPSYWQQEVAYVKAYRDLHVTGVAFVGADAHISFTTISNKLHRVERCDDLVGANWTTVTNGVPGTGAPAQAIDTGAAGQARRFYRVRLLY
jgi:Spherulation-specific family 4